MAPEVFGVFGLRCPGGFTAPCSDAGGHAASVADAEQQGASRPIDVLVHFAAGMHGKAPGATVTIATGVRIVPLFRSRN
jgi:hypothetical protein